MIKKITAFAVLAVLCLNFTVLAQQTVNRPYKVGDKLREGFWQQEYTVYHQGKSSRQNLSKYREGLLLLDFWASWCTGCIQKFPLADSIARTHGDKVAIVLVNSLNSGDTEQKISARLSAYGPNLATLIGDTILRKLFPHQLLPHYIWIEGGEVRAATGGEFFTPSNIEAAIQRRNKLNQAIEKRKNKLNHEE